MTQSGRPRREDEKPDSPFGKALKEYLRRVEKKAPLAHIVEQVMIVQTISFLLGSPVDVRIIHEEDDFFFFHNELSCSEYEFHDLFSSVVLEVPPIPVLNC